ncbi:MAG: hypothetical protein ACTHMU_12700, partial [Thermomicrobiales bacterium]
MTNMALDRARDQRPSTRRKRARTSARKPLRRQLPPRLTTFVIRHSSLVILLLLSFVALLLVYARPLTATIPVGAPGDRAGVLDFFDRERNPAGVPYRWTRDRSTLIFHAAGLALPANRTATLELHLVGSRPAGVAAPRVTVTRAGQAGGTQTIAGESQARFAVGTVGG